MSRLSTHVLDTSIGKPAAGVRVRVFDSTGEVASALTDKDGRCSSLLPDGKTLKPDNYRLIFDIGSYFQSGFYPEIVISITVRDAATHHHVPLLISPYGYTTYRGS
jgi:5-hydroxyisourate hydrolase